MQFLLLFAYKRPREVTTVFLVQRSPIIKSNLREFSIPNDAFGATANVGFFSRRKNTIHR